MESPHLGHLVTPDLLKALREVFPFNRPLPSDTERVIFLRSGHQEVIEFLAQQYEERFTQALDA